MGIIYGDSAEPKEIHRLFKKRIGDQYQIKQLGILDCIHEKILLEKENYEICAYDYEVNVCMEAGLKPSYNKAKCHNCSHMDFVRCADFTNEVGSFYVERKTVGDFLSSMKDRLYNQMNKMDSFISGSKIIILEGTPRGKDVRMFNDSKNFFSGIDKKSHDLRGLSPIEQAIILSGRKEWVWSFIREAFMRGIMFIQSWDMAETVEFIIQADEGFEKISKHRIIPKKYPNLPMEQAILNLFKGVGLKRAKSIMQKNPILRMKIKNLIKYMNTNYVK